MKEYILRSYDNGATELICVSDNVKRIVYNTGDIVDFVNDIPVSIQTYDGVKWQDITKSINNGKRSDIVKSNISDRAINEFHNFQRNRG